MVEGPCKACGKVVTFKVGKVSMDLMAGVLADKEQLEGMVELTCPMCGVMNPMTVERMKKYKNRLWMLIEHIEDSIIPSDLIIEKKTLSLYMNMEDEKEVERLASDLYQMFRHLRRNCSWFFEERNKE